MKVLLSILLVVVYSQVLGQVPTKKDSMMVDEINNLRTKPKSYIKNVRLYIMICQDKLNRVKEGVLTTTVDYKKHIEAAEELMSVLDTIKPLSELSLNLDMFSVTKEHSEYLSTIGRANHIDNDGKTAKDRMSDIDVDNVTENIITDNGIVIAALISLLVDGDINDRGHRDNILDPNAKFVSVHSAGDFWVMNFAN